MLTEKFEDWKILKINISIFRNNPDGEYGWIYGQRKILNAILKAKFENEKILKINISKL